MHEGKPAPIETPEDMKALIDLLKEKYPDDTPDVIAAAARVLRKIEQEEGRAVGEEDVVVAIQRAREARAESVPNNSYIIDGSNLTVMPRGTKPEDERAVG